MMNSQLIAQLHEAHVGLLETAQCFRHDPDRVVLLTSSGRNNGFDEVIVC